MPAAKRPTKKRATTSRSAKRTASATRTTKRTASAKRTTKRTATRTTKAATRGTRPAKRPRRGAPRDAIAVLKADHRTVEQLFKRFEQAGDGAARTKRKLVDQIIEELSRHAEIEELVFYPAVRRRIDDVESDVLEAIEEHHVVKVLLRELEDLAPSHERFDAKVTVLIENVRHHVKEEEHDLFPEVRDGLGRADLVDLGRELEQAKPTVPTRPHPWAPDEPPANAIVGSAVAALDKARTVGKQAVERVRSDGRR